VTARLVVAGTHSGVGKTTVATGLMAAFERRGRRVAGFKVGPDFIDPSYHALATGRPGRNLDAFMSGPGLIAPLLAHGAAGADLAVVEGVMGMFDGASGSGELASTAQVAKLLRAAVLLVVDCSAMARSVAALVHGFVSFDPGISFAGVILNRVGSDRHEALLREALEPLGVPVLGALRRHAELANPERHLGLVPAAERRSDAARAVAELAGALTEACDLEAIESAASAAPRLLATPWDPAAAAAAGMEGMEGTAGSATPVRLGVASGPAFSFLYQENLELLEAGGAELVPIDPTTDGRLPDGVSGLYLGGGFPETFAEALSANRPLRDAVRGFAAGGAPVVAECGGLLYLARSLDGHPMCGVLEADGRMTGRLTLGYRRASAAAASALGEAGMLARGHEFHYSRVEPPAGGTARTSAAWLLDGGRGEGFVAGGVHASYLHTHWAAFPQMPLRLVAAARDHAAAVSRAGSGAQGAG
jgi:cobyrinic acid a,c-diamide synthase